LTVPGNSSTLGTYQKKQRAAGDKGEKNTMSYPITAPLNHDWRNIFSAEGGEILIRLDDSRENYVLVSYSTYDDLTEDELIKILVDSRVDIDLDVQPDYGLGWSPHEALSWFKLKSLDPAD
jgi:hypothetical protein